MPTSAAANCHTFAPSSSAAMSTILRTLGNLRRIGLKVRPAPIGLPDPANRPRPGIWPPIALHR